MVLKYIKGIPAALFANYAQYQAQKLQQNVFYILRVNSDLVSYLGSAENLAEYSFAGVVKTIADFGYERAKVLTDIGQFSVKGDIISIWAPGFPDPVRLSYFDQDLESIVSYDVITGRKLDEYKNFPIGDLSKLSEKSDWGNISLIGKFERLADEVLVLQGLLAEPGPTVESLETPKWEPESKVYDFEQPQLYFKRFDLLESDITKYESQKIAVKIVTQHLKELPVQLHKYANTKTPANLPLTDIEHSEMGFISSEYSFALLTDRELFGTIFISTRRKRNLKSSEAQKLLSQLEGEIEIGDFIVHEDYGVGIYEGFVIEEGNDYLKLQYAQGDELFVPLEQINKLTKYIAEGDGGTPQVTRLGKTDWETIRKKVKAQVAIAAQELARHYANLKLATALAVDKEDSEGYKDFLARFQYEPTTDQLQAERQIVADMAKTTPMNRLLIGDVGFGKTEVMMRAAFKVIEQGAQVVILCPTTVLALQHYKNFKQRFGDSGADVCLLSRLNSGAENKALIAEVESGKYEIVIATHRALSSDFKVKRLGLLIVDEEQRFGVKQKEKVRKLEHGTHTLFVSATPIPRTLSMALSAIQDISIIQTPPPGRLAVDTKVAKLDWKEVAKAINFEVARGGQVFFVHNEIQTIASIQARLKTLLPDVRFIVGHGQMAAEKLDKIMTDFYAHKYDCLIATTIIENGLDMPNVNTIIVNSAHKFGLAQMYQLRGRVGRSSVQAYAYFFFQGRDLEAEKELRLSIDDSEDAPGEKIKPAKYIERLETILSAQSLGSGFRIASRDLEIRGAGNLLGREQHGSISKVGYGLYMQMLAEEIERVKAE